MSPTSSLHSRRRLMRAALMISVALAAFCASSANKKAKAGVLSDLDLDQHEEDSIDTHSSVRSASGLKASAKKKEVAAKDVDDEMEDLDAEFDSGVDAVLSRKDDELDNHAMANDDEDDEQEQPDEIDYSDKDEDEDDDDEEGPSNKKLKKGSKTLKKEKKDRGTGVLPQLADQAEKLLAQANELLENAEVFKREVAELGGLPKRLDGISEKMKKLAKDPSYATNALMYNTQAKKVKEQARRIEDIISQLLRSIPDYEREAEKLTLQSEKLRDLADQHILQSVSSEDESVIELRKEVRGLEKDYGKNLRKSNQLRKSLQQLKEQGDQVDQLVRSLPYHEDDDKKEEDDVEDKHQQNDEEKKKKNDKSAGKKNTNSKSKGLSSKGAVKQPKTSNK